VKKLVVTLAVIALVLGMVVAGLVWHESRKRSERSREALEDTREEARKLVHLCELDGFVTKLEMGTSHFFAYFHTDQTKAREVLTTIVDPVIEAQDYACTSALTLVKLVQRDAPTPDRWIDDAAPKLEANLAIIARTRAASAALATALATQSDLPTLVAKLHELLESATPPPGGK
jgi:hypothetical protein